MEHMEWIQSTCGLQYQAVNVSTVPLVPANGVLDKKAQRRHGNHASSCGGKTRTQIPPYSYFSLVVTTGYQILVIKVIPHPRLVSGRKDRHGL